MSAPAASGEREQTRARYPDAEGRVERDGVGVHWERYGEGDPPILFLPTWTIIHSRCWKAQIPYFARRHRVIAFDPRGNGRSDRPSDPAAYLEDEYAADALAVLDATKTAAAVVVGFSLGAQRGLILAAEHPDRVRGLVLVGPALPLAPSAASDGMPDFATAPAGTDGWERYAAASWRADYPGFLEFFFSQVFTEPHSTKQIEDCVDWGLDTDAETLIAAENDGLDTARAGELCARLRCPALVVHGDDDRIIGHGNGAKTAELTGGVLVTIAGGGHCPQARDPVKFNLLLREFVAALPPTEGGTDGHRR